MRRRNIISVMRDNHKKAATRAGYGLAVLGGIGAVAGFNKYRSVVRDKERDERRKRYEDFKRAREEEANNKGLNIYRPKVPTGESFLYEQFCIIDDYITEFE